MSGAQALLLGSGLGIGGMKGLELLNTMALLDGEREFLDNDFSGDIDVSFESGEKAREAFEYTSLSERAQSSGGGVKFPALD